MAQKMGSEGCGGAVLLLLLLKKEMRVGHFQRPGEASPGTSTLPLDSWSLA